ncbi:MAG: hypothetical protein V2A65_07975 [Candidatus Omnitrophota bacterium]
MTRLEIKEGVLKEANVEKLSFKEIGEKICCGLMISLTIIQKSDQEFTKMEDYNLPDYTLQQEILNEFSPEYYLSGISILGFSPSGISFIDESNKEYYKGYIHEKSGVEIFTKISWPSVNNNNQ